MILFAHRDSNSKLKMASVDYFTTYLPRATE